MYNLLLVEVGNFSTVVLNGLGEEITHVAGICRGNCRGGPRHTINRNNPTALVPGTANRPALPTGLVLTIIMIMVMITLIAL